MAVGGSPAGSGSLDSKSQIREIFDRKIDIQGSACGAKRLSRGVASQGSARCRRKRCFLRVSTCERTCYHDRMLTAGDRQNSLARERIPFRTGRLWKFHSEDKGERIVNPRAGTHH